MNNWEEFQLSAFLHELGRRVGDVAQKGKRKKRSWVELPPKEIWRLYEVWPDKRQTSGRSAPLIRQPYHPLVQQSQPHQTAGELAKELSESKWPFGPVIPCTTNDGEVLWNKNEPAWTEAYVVCANLNCTDKAIERVFKEWLAGERKRTGIQSPRGGSNQEMGNVWRFVEAVDRKSAGLPMDEIRHSICSKAAALWQAITNPPLPVIPRSSSIKNERDHPRFSPAFIIQMALRDIPKHGKIPATGLQL